MVSGMYSFFRWSCSVTAKRLADFDSALRNAGWTREGKWKTALFERSEWIAPVDH